MRWPQVNLDACTIKFRDRRPRADQQVAKSDTDRLAMAGPSAPLQPIRGQNLGIVCGRVIGIDIDADDPNRATQLETLAAEYLGPTSFQRVGRAPRTLLLYRPAAGEIIASMTKLAGCIDLLSGGRQFVAFGIHPDTGKQYQWIAASPATAKLNDLPIITAQRQDRA